MYDFFALLKENQCNNALDLINGQLIIDYVWSDCQWLISAQDDDLYVTLEAQNIDVKIYCASKNDVIV